MSLRVIAGSARGTRLRRVPGKQTRPIGDRAKEALFSILSPQIHGCRFLDLFAGTGSVGIEALSRGSAQSTFIEQNRAALQTIRHNLQRCRLSHSAHIRVGDVFRLLQQPTAEPFDFLFLAPPQYRRLWAQTLLALDSAATWWHSSSTIIVQIDPSEREDIALTHWQESDWRRYGNTALWFFQRRGASPGR
ncbi:MAG: 16S rRNA (guanine(966)-N(2))-methyltransferase RsmD [Anaerolineaceae bacterium]|nr:16S rRNA (guanine(966)-N(2))-methyltransferase RsmD [Anaerolineaceae bacterium]